MFKLKAALGNTAIIGYAIDKTVDFTSSETYGLLFCLSLMSVWNHLWCWESSNAAGTNPLSSMVLSYEGVF